MDGVLYLASNKIQENEEYGNKKNIRAGGSPRTGGLVYVSLEVTYTTSGGKNPKFTRSAKKGRRKIYNMLSSNIHESTN